MSFEKKIDELIDFCSWLNGFGKKKTANDEEQDTSA